MRKQYIIPQIAIQHMRPLAVVCTSGEPDSEFTVGGPGDPGSARVQRRVF